ncbi:MAG: hypothetical protein M1815_005226 [Lichina confinis]|nr:MAG: hypothetical protein M1815_005226 [Lichina confinis]
MSSSRSAARPKRAGETFARTHDAHDDNGRSSKKPRFDIRNPSTLAPDAPEEDEVLGLDEIGKGGQQTKRGAVNLDGYGSDSSNEGFDARAERKAGAARKSGKQNDPSEQEEQNDMFADLEEDLKDGDEDEELDREGKKKAKNVRFLEDDEIEGQVENSRGGGHVSADFASQARKGKERAKADASSSDSEVEGGQGDDDGVDEEVGAGGKKVRAPKLSAFNMKEELEEGRFDTEGNFVRKAIDPDAVHDAWLEGVTKKEQKRAREAEQKRAEEQRQRILADDQVLTSDALATLIGRTERGETALEALARLGREIEKSRPKRQIRRKGRRREPSQAGGGGEDDNDDGGDGAMDVDTNPQADPQAQAQQRRRDDLDAITGAADLLLTRGQANIYDDTREALTRQYRRETGDEWVERTQGDAASPPSPPHSDTANGHGGGATTALHTDIGPSTASSAAARAAPEPGPGPGPAKWEYRWIDARDGGQVHGPYEGATMASWHEAGFFQAGVVEVRRHQSHGEWTRSLEFT